MPSFIALQEYMIHQPAGWIKYIEAKTGGQVIETETGIKVFSWEEWRSSLRSRWLLKPILNFAAGAATLYVIYCSGTVLWAGERVFVQRSASGFLFGIALASGAYVFADK